MRDLDPFVLTLVGQALNSCAARTCIVWVNDEEGGQLSGRAFAHGAAGSASPIRHPGVELLSGLAGWVLRNARPLIVNDWLQGPFQAQQLGREGSYQMAPIMCVPALRHDKVIGAVAVIRPERMVFTESDIAALTEIAQAIAVRQETPHDH